MPTKRPEVPAPPPPPSGRAAVAWEYRSLLLPREANLAQFGAEGWELVSVTPAPADQAMFYFKRRA